MIRRRIKKISYPEGFDKNNHTAGNDIALITLVDKIEESQIVPVCLPWKGTKSHYLLLKSDSLKDKRFSFTGWGNNQTQKAKKSYDGQTYTSFSDTPRKIDLKIVSKQLRPAARFTGN